MYSLDEVRNVDPEIAEAIVAEQQRQNSHIELIASENWVSKAVMAAMGSPLTNKYAEGYPAEHKSGNKGRYYGGCENVDMIEEACIDAWQKAFNTDYHVNVQPHSGSQANYAAFASVLKPGDTILSLDLNNGGHLSHGSSVNFSGKLYNVKFYGITNEGYIDYDQMERLIFRFHPQLVLAGASAYPRVIDFERIYKIIGKVESFSQGTYRPIFMVDMAHIAGLVIAGDHPSPFGYADIITTTTHKTLRGPRGGLIFCKPELAKKIDSAVFPGSQGGPLMHIIAAKAVAGYEAQTEEFKQYIHQVVKNCKAMSDRFIELGYKVITGGTDNHLLLLDLTDTGLTGKEVQDYLDEFAITLNKNCIPNEKRSPKEASGVRIGTAAMTTKGYKEDDFVKVADSINTLIKRKIWFKNRIQTASVPQENN